MKKMFKKGKKTIVFIAAATLALLDGQFVSAQAVNGNQAPEEVLGRTVVERGTMTVLSGTIFLEKEEWYLKTSAGVYELHLGRYGHEEGYLNGLNPGAEAEVTGYIFRNHVSPITLVSGGMTYAFRGENGMPLWAGRGDNRAERPLPNSEENRRFSRNEPSGWGRNRI